MEQLNLHAIRSRVVSDSESDRHIFFGVDNKFMSHALITVMSLAENAGESAYQFHIISSELEENDARNFAKILVNTRHGLTLHHAENDLFDSLPTTALFTRATYYRLLAPLLVPGAEKVLYLDADMICTNSLEPLWAFPASEKDIALVVGEFEELQPKLAANAGLKNSRYFNAGMMMINVTAWNQADVSDKAFRILTTPGKPLKYLDQDALNIVLEEKVHYVDRRFNYIEMLAHDEKGYRRDIPPETCIIHYAGADKPWQEWNQQRVCQHYRNIYRRSPIAGQPFDLPHNPQQAKKMYKAMFRTHQLLRGVYWQFQYYQMKYF